MSRRASGWVVAAILIGGVSLVSIIDSSGTSTTSAAPGQSCADAPGHYKVLPNETYRTIAIKLGLNEIELANANATSNTQPSVTTDLRDGRCIHLSAPASGGSTTTTAAPTTTTDATTTTVAPTTTAPSTTTTTAAPTTTTVPVTTTTSPATTTTTTVPETTTTTTVPESTTTTTIPLPDSDFWSESFSTAASLDRLVFDVHNDGTWPLRPFDGDHNHACQGPTTYRPLVEQRDDVNGVSDMIWWCAPAGPDTGHFMTGMNTEGYTIISFSPKGDDGFARIFPATANQICWDQNLTDLGGRKWTQLAIVSDDTFIANGRRIPYRNPDFSDVAGETTLDIGADGFLFNNLRNSTEFFKGSTGTVLDEFGLPRITDKASRYRICVRDNGNGTVTRTQARPGGNVHSITGPGSFPAGPRVFILEDDTYNADKDYDGPPKGGSFVSPYTWHWDNIEISAG